LSQYAGSTYLDRRWNYGTFVTSSLWQLGVLLFERTGKAVNLTDAGRLFLKEARAVLERTDEAVRNVRGFAQTGETELHVGYLPIPSAHIVPAAK
jgi:DNA-binding transcriptional LysR family regulator